MSLHTMSVGKRLGVGFGLVLFLMLGITGLASFSMTQMNSTTEKIV